MLIDALGRELKNDDIVVIKNRDKLIVGIVYKSSVRTLDGLKRSNYIFLIKNPSADELEIKEKIIEKFEEEKKKKKKPIIGKEIGSIYKMNSVHNGNKQYSLYLGYGDLEVKKDGKTIVKETGHFYIPFNYYEKTLGDIKKLTLDDILALTFSKYDFIHSMGFTKSTYKNYRQIESKVGSCKILASIEYKWKFVKKSYWSSVVEEENDFEISFNRYDF